MDKFFGEIENTWAGFSAEHTISIPYFEKDVEIFLGEEFDEDGEEVSTPPTIEQLAEYEDTVKNFLSSIDSIIVDIQQKAFDYYKNVYAKYYETPFEVIFQNSMIHDCGEGRLHPPLKIDSKEKHFDYMKDIVDLIRVLDNKTIVIPIRYALDHEHGLEIKIVDNTVMKIGGISE